ncbi:MAG: MmgE/PrpD family protein, partial [Desulfotignum sp.]|nr:MmgE/PrpD family protein [Desulfotignum sp.]
MMDHTVQVLDFIQDITWEDLPETVQHQAKRCLLDSTGAMVAGHETPVGKMMDVLASEQFPGDHASIMVSGRRVSA